MLNGQKRTPRSVILFGENAGTIFGGQNRMSAINYLESSLKTFWNAYFGMLTDKFGIQWMVNYDYSQQS